MTSGWVSLKLYLVICEGIHSQGLSPHVEIPTWWGQMSTIWHSGGRIIWPALSLVAVIAQAWIRWCGKFSDPAIWVWAKQVWAFRQSKRSSLNMESWHLKLSILSLKCATGIYAMSWSHVLLMRSICCASDTVGQEGLTNLLRSDNLASKLFLTVPFSWLLAMANDECPGWCRIMSWPLVQNFVLQKSSLGAQGSVDLNHVFLAYDSRIARILMNKLKHNLSQKIY